MAIRDRNATALVTGGTGGIGSAIARALHEQGIRVIVQGRDREKLQSWKESDGYIPVAADLTNATGLDALCDLCQREGVNWVIHSAGILDFSLFEEQPERAISAMIEVNLKAPMLLTRRLLPSLQDRGDAVIIFVGSTFGAIGHPGFAAYCATKFALRGFAESLRRELADRPVAIHHLAPRATRTAINDGAVDALNAELGNVSDNPEVVAGHVMELLSAAGGQCRFIGWPETLFVRLNTLFPRLVDRALARRLGAIRRLASGE